MPEVSVSCHHVWAVVIMDLFIRWPVNQDACDDEGGEELRRDGKGEEHTREQAWGI